MYEDNIKATTISNEFDEIIEDFLNHIRGIFQTDEYAIKGLFAEPVDFSITNIATDSYNETTAAMRRLQCAAREKLINPMIYCMLQNNNQHTFYDSIHIAKRGVKKHYQYAQPLLSEYESSAMVEFVIRKNGRYRFDAVRYSIRNITSQEFIRFCRFQLIKNVYYIDWDNDSKYKGSLNFEHPTRFTKKIIHISPASFFEEFLSDDDYQLFIRRVREAIDTAKDIMGFITVRTLTPSYLHEFKKVLKNDLDTLNLRTSVYHWINDDYSITPMDFKSLESYSKQGKRDIDTIIDNYHKSNKHHALIGSGGFAECYITSEYLRMLFLKGDHGIEYTAVVCGYLKAVEQLLYAFIEMLLDSGRFTNYHIEHGGKKAYNKLNATQKAHVNNLRDAGKLTDKQIPFQRDYEIAFNTTMAYLVNFLQRIPTVWKVSGSGKDLICERLSNYTQYCRNEHFHKDNISDKNYVEIIRNNTQTLALLLIGSIDMGICNKSPNEILSIDENNYEELVEILKNTRIPSVYYITYGESEYMTHKDYHKQIIHYDKKGNQVNNEFDFVLIDNRNEMYLSEPEYRQWYQSKKKITISQDNIPDKIEYEYKAPPYKRIQIWPK